MRGLSVSFAAAAVVYIVAFSAAALGVSARRITFATIAAGVFTFSWAAASNPFGASLVSIAGRTFMSGPAVSVATLLILLAVYAWFRRIHSLIDVLPRLALAWLMMLAVDFRVQSLALEYGKTLWPDVTSVQDVLSVMTHPYDTGVREPLWPWALWISQKLLAPNELALRLVSLAASVAIVPVAYLFGRDYGHSKLLGLVTAAFMTTHGWLIGSSVQAHRTELLILGATAVAYFALVDSLERRRRLLGLTVAGAALALTSLATMVVTFPLALWAWYRDRLRIRDVGIVLAVTAVVLAPYIAYNYARFGTYSLFTTRYVPMFYRNLEFVALKGTGCRGCPTLEEFRRSNYSGDPISMGEYLFGLHTPAEVASRMSEGFTMTYLRPGNELAAVVGGASLLRYGLFLIGSVLELTTRRREILALFPLSLNLTAFVVPLGIEVRLLVGVAVFAAYIQAVPVALALSIGGRALGARFDALRSNRDELHHLP